MVWGNESLFPAYASFDQDGCHFSSANFRSGGHGLNPTGGIIHFMTIQHFTAQSFSPFHYLNIS